MGAFYIVEEKIGDPEVKRLIHEHLIRHGGCL